MKPSAVFAIAFVFIPSLVAADCFGGDKQLPDHGLEVIEFMYASGCDLQHFGNLGPGKEFKKSIKTSDNICVNVNVWNKSDSDKTLTASQAVDAWSREWVGCDHGGRRKYDDGLEYS